MLEAARKQLLNERLAQFAEHEPALRELERRLLEIGGEALVPVPEPDLMKILNRGELFSGTVKMNRGATKPVSLQRVEVLGRQPRQWRADSHRVGPDGRRALATAQLMRSRLHYAYTEAEAYNRNHNQTPGLLRVSDDAGGVPAFLLGERTMSKIQTSKCPMQDREALERALDEFTKKHKLALERDKSPRYYATSFGRKAPVCEYVIVLPGRYDLGIQRQKDGSYVFVADNELMGGQYGSDGYGRGDQGRKILGEDCRLLLREYHTQSALLEANLQGVFADDIIIRDDPSGTRVIDLWVEVEEERESAGYF